LKYFEKEADKNAQAEIKGVVDLLKVEVIAGLGGEVALIGDDQSVIEVHKCTFRCARSAVLTYFFVRCT
jgi:hypothetical protein